MKIDPLQPVLYDNDTNPGVGAGWWQANPFAASLREFGDEQQDFRNGNSIKPKTVFLLQGVVVAVVGGFIAAGWFGLLL